VRFLHNWSWTPRLVTPPVDCRDAVTGKQLPAGRDLELSAWDVRVLVEDEPAGRPNAAPAGAAERAK
jgi:hypothetical protein